MQNIWDFITDHAKRKYNVTIERDILKKIHLNGLFMNILDKMNITLNIDPKDIDFNRVN